MAKKFIMKAEPVKPERKQIFQSIMNYIGDCNLQDIIDGAKEFGLEPKDVLLEDDGGWDHSDVGYRRMQTDEEYDRELLAYQDRYNIWLQWRKDNREKIEEVEEQKRKKEIANYEKQKKLLEKQAAQIGKKLKSLESKK